MSDLIKLQQNGVNLSVPNAGVVTYEVTEKVSADSSAILLDRPHSPRHPQIVVAAP